ncbi:hypothetical protein EYS14_00950 [Alteromonadaceae bacterium M269]|nr:hypothetical protein EYS14_00950 [Alteromonadaceae bacterium M269]
MSENNLPVTPQENPEPKGNSGYTNRLSKWLQQYINARRKSLKANKLMPLLRFFSERLGLVIVILALVFTHLSADKRQQETKAFDELYHSLFHHTPPSFDSSTIATENHNYLKQAEREAIDDLLKISEVSAALDVVSSSQVGISFIAEFNVTLGHALNELNRGVKRAMEVNMLSAAAIKVIGIIARAGEHTHQILISLCLWSWLFYFVLDIASEHVKVPASVVRQVRVLSGRVLILFVTFYLLLPYSIHFSALVSQQLHAKIKEDNRTKLDNLHSSLVIADDKKDSSKDSFKAKAKSSINHLSKTQAKGIHKKVQSLFSYLLISLTITLFDLVIMPIVILYGLYRICRQVLIVDDKITNEKVLQ